MPSRPKQFASRVPSKDPRHVESKRFYDSARWARLRALVLAEEPICRDCERNVSVIAHHLIERLQRPDLELVRENLIGLCDECHTRRHKGNRSWSW